MGSDNLISGDEAVEYTVYFENLPAAALPAQVVEVVDTLDPDIFDLTTFQLREVQIGNSIDQRVALDRISRDRFSGRTDTEFRAGTRAFHTLRVSHVSGASGETFDVELEFELDRETGEARWLFETVTEDPLKGFRSKPCTPPLHRR